MLAFQANNALRLKQLNPPRLGRALRLQRGVYEGFLKLYGQEHPETLRRYFVQFIEHRHYDINFYTFFFLLAPLLISAKVSAFY